MSLDPLNIERTVRGFTSIPIIFYDRYYPSNNLDRLRANDCRLSAPPSLFLSRMVHRNHDGRVTESHFRPNLSTNRLNRRVQFFDSPMETISNFPSFSLRWIRHFYIRKFCSLIIRINEKFFKLSFKKNNDSCLPNFPFQDQTTRKPFLPSSSSSSSESQIAAAFEKPRTDNFAAR